MKIVLDTNVVVSGLLSPHGPSGEIVRMASGGVLSLFYDARILAEYREVLHRPKFRFDPRSVEAFLDQVHRGGELVAAEPLPAPLPDPDDEPFLAVSLAGTARCLVTNNLRHYPPRKRQGMTVIDPFDFLDLYRRETKTG